MNENEGLDVSRVVSLIMENPQLIEQIANLAKAKEMPDNENKEPNESANGVATAETVATPTYSQPQPKSSNRSQLFGALKSYVSAERAKAIDSMLAIADIIDMMRAR